MDAAEFTHHINDLGWRVDNSSGCVYCPHHSELIEATFPRGTSLIDLEDVKANANKRGFILHCEVDNCTAKITSY